MIYTDTVGNSRSFFHEIGTSGKGYVSAVAAAAAAADLSRAQQKDDPNQQGRRISPSDASMQIEREKLQIAHDGLNLQKTRLSIEEWRARREFYNTLITAGSILAPLLALLVTVIWQARAAFQLKAAEIVVGSRDTWAAERRLAVLRHLFPRRFRRGLPSSMEELNLPSELHQQRRIELFKALAANPGRKRQIIQVARTLYPDDKTLLVLLAELEGRRF